MVMRRFLGALACVALLAASDASPPAFAAGDASDLFDPQAALAYSQAAIGRQVGDHAFLDDQREVVNLSAFRGRPLIVNLVYTGCAESCPIVVQTLLDAVEEAQDVFGRDHFSVVTVGFDTRDDTPEQMHAYARGQGVDLANWRFLSGDAETVERLIEEVGFIYMPSPRGFDHIAQTTILDDQGRVYRQVYGSDFEAPAVVEPLKELVFETGSTFSSLSGVIDRVRLFCTFYDSKADRYIFDYSIIIALVIGSLSLLGTGTVLVRSWLRSRPPEKSA
jgi:protein SCO1/2